MIRIGKNTILLNEEGEVEEFHSEVTLHDNEEKHVLFESTIGGLKVYNKHDLANKIFSGEICTVSRDGFLKEFETLEKTQNQLEKDEAKELAYKLEKSENTLRALVESLFYQANPDGDIDNGSKDEWTKAMIKFYALMNNN